MQSLTEMLNDMMISQADSLQFRPGQPPLLFVRGEPRPLSAEPLTTGALSTLMDRVVDADQLAGLVATGKVNGTYHAPGLGDFELRVRRLPEGMALAFRYDAGKASAPPGASALPAMPPSMSGSGDGLSAGSMAGGAVPGGSPPGVALGADRVAPAPGRHSRPQPLLAPPSRPSGSQRVASVPTRHSGPQRVAATSGRHARPQPVAMTSSRGSSVDGDMLDQPEWVSRFRATRSVHDMLRLMVLEHCSDLVLSHEREARVRKVGDYRAIPGRTFRERDILEAVGEVMTPARRERLDDSGSVDLALELPGDGDERLRFRINVFKTLSGMAAAFRPVWSEVPGLDALKLPRQVGPLAGFPNGLVLVCGPTGSGKSTTLSALIDQLNANNRRHIITLEDPIEYVFTDKQSVVHQREIGVHVESFAAGLRSALREAPDVILVGEMRDLETISSAVTAAETGHLVLSTLHSGSAGQAIDRMIDVFPEHQQAQVRMQVSDVLRAIVTQRLLPTADGKGRVPVVEVVRVTYAISNMIRERRTHHFPTAIQSGRKDGMLPFDVSLAELVKSGDINREAALRVARDPKHLTTLLDG